MELVVHGFEIGGVLILVVGSLAAFVTAAVSFRRVGGLRAYEGARRNVGRAILLGLEFLIIADIVLTITVVPTLESALALGLIVLVRTFLSSPSRSSWRVPALASSGRRRRTEDR